MDGIGTSSWWLSVVVAGLLVNLASAYLKPRLDGALLRSSSWWRSHSAERLAKRRRRVDALRGGSDKLKTAAYLGALESRLSVIESYSVALFSLIMGISTMMASTDSPTLNRMLNTVGTCAVVVSLLGYVLAQHRSNKAAAQFSVLREAIAKEEMVPGESQPSR